MLFRSAETKNEAQALVYTIEKTLKDFEGKVDAKELEEITKEKNELKDLLEKDDMDVVKKKVEELNKLLQEASTKLYQKVKKAEDEAKDSEIDEKKKNKKKVVDAEVVDDEE